MEGTPLLPSYLLFPPLLPQAVIRFSPITVILPLLLLGLCIGLGLWGVVSAAEEDRNQSLKFAVDATTMKATAIEKQMRSTLIPLKVGQEQCFQ